jgi:RNA polymerase sigma factor (sigma-70 family)
MSRVGRPDSENRPANATPEDFLRYHQELRRFLLRRVGDPHNASDLVQEVYVRLLSLDRGTLVRNPQAYMYGIAAHVAREFRTRSQRDRVSYDSQTLQELAEHSEPVSPDEFVDGLGIEQHIEQALAQLSPNHLKVLIADRRDGLPAEDIARRLGLSVHTVRKYIVQALSHIRESWRSSQGQRTHS